jgi:hypothetical protein
MGTKLKKWFLKNWWKLLTFLGAAVGLIVVSKFVVAKIGEVFQPRRFKFVPDDPTALLIRDEDGEYIKVDLPDGIVSSQVTAAGVNTNAEWTVEVKHEKIDFDSAGGPSGDPDLGL